MINTLKRTLALLILAGSLVPMQAFAAFDGPRVYWPLPQNTNILSAHMIRGAGNATLTNWSHIQPSVTVNSDVFLINYTRVQPIFGRTAYWQAFLPLETIQTSSSLPLPSDDAFVNGLGDPSFSGIINLYGAPGLKAKDYLRHEPRLSVNAGVNLSLPLGQYDEDQSLNLGANQIKTRLYFPTVASLRPWVPGKRMTLEIVPSVVLFSDNDDAQGSRIEQDLLYSLECHLTHDITQKAFLSLDYTWIEGGEETYKDKSSGVVVMETDGVDTNLLGMTLGFEINDNLRLSLTHMLTTAEEVDGESLEASLTKISFTWSWHDVLEKVRVFKGDN